MLQIPELLAPAGDAERLRYAINYGAGAGSSGICTIKSSSLFTPLSVIADAMPPHRIGFCKPDSGAAIGTPLGRAFSIAE